MNKTSTVLPSMKGQITLPPDIRRRYNISKDTPLVIKDNGKGRITITVNRLVAYDQDVAEFYDTEKSKGINFKKPIKTSSLLDIICNLDG
jgi:bifunctional DNA-binding transcriptional regulator/antitoxin component of YhaV-PrlF toxin-antitoxin module